MKAIKISVLAFTLGLMSFSVVPEVKPSIVKTADATAVVWKSESIELGEIPQNQPKKITFEFKNTGKTAVLITDVKASCGCTATDYTKTPVQPNQTATVIATYNAANKGAFSKTVTVTTNADAAPKVLTFKGTVI